MAIPLGVMSLELRQDFLHQKTRVRGLSYDIASVILGLAMFVQLRLETDRRAGGLTEMTAYTVL